MIENLKNSWKLRKLRIADIKTAKAFQVDRLAAKNENKNRDAFDHIDGLERFERSLFWDEIEQIKTRKICLAASHYDVFVSQDADWWEESHVLGGRYLSTKGFNELRSAIRKEKNDRWSYWELRIKVIGFLATAMTGAIGAWIGLVAILQK